MAFINRLPSGGGSSATGTATPSKVLAGETFSSDAGEGLVGEIPKKSAQTYTPNDSTQTISSGQYLEGAQTISPVSTEDRTVTAGTSDVTVTRNTGKYMNKVVVSPTPSEEKTATAGTSAVEVTPTSGKLLSKVTINPTPSQSKNITPSASQQTVSPDSGKLLSSVVVAGDADLVAGNVAKGKEIFGVTGTYTSDANATAGEIASGKTAYVNGVKLTGTGASFKILDFPLSIQDTQPTAVRAGHIWVKSSTLASQITSISIQEGLNAGVANNSLQFVVSETGTSYISVSETKNLTSGGNNIAVGHTQNNGGGQEWIVSNNSVVYKLNKPMIYSKIGGVLDIETAYMWNGSSWILLCEKGSYAIFVNYTGIEIYNKIGDTFSLSQTFTDTGYGTVRSLPPNISRDGRLFINGTKVYKRIGDTYSLYYTFPTGSTNFNGTVIQNIARLVTPDGSRIILVGYTVVNSNTYQYRVATYVDNGTTIVPESLSPVYANFDLTSAQFNSGHGAHKFVVNDAGTFVAVVASTTSVGDHMMFFFRSGTSFEGVGYKITGTFYKTVLNSSGSHLIVGVKHSTNYGLAVYQVDHVNKTISLAKTFDSGNSSNVVYPSWAMPNGKILCEQNFSPYLYDIGANTWTAITKADSSTSLNNGHIVGNLQGDRFIVPATNSSTASYRYMKYDASANTLSTLVNTSSAWLGNDGLNWEALIPF